MRRSLPLAYGFMAAVLAAWPALADEPPPTDCDRLAAAPGSVAGVDGVAFEAIDAAAAVAACGQAMAEYPDAPRFMFQYGRALDRAGDRAAAERLYAWAAAAGYTPAEAAPVEPEPAVTAAAPAATPGPVEVDPAEEAAILERMAAVLAEDAAAVPRDSFDPAAVVAEAGSSVEALTAWVGANVALVPYRGSLRGARGALMDRTGNSLDRALLLADLLASAGREVRLAHTLLDMPAARSLLATVAPPPAHTAPPAETSSLADKLVAAAGPYAGALQAELGQATDAALAQREAVAARAADLAPALLALAGSVPPPVGEPAATALADHWWVQVRDGDTWIDADPSAAIVGAPTPQETLAPQDLPETLEHRVTLRLVIEVWDNGSLREAPVLTHRLAPAELIDRPVLLRQVPVSAPSLAQLTADGGDVAAAMLAAAADAWVWQPTLAIGDELVTDQLFTMRGEVLPAGEETLRSLGLGEQVFGDQAAATDDALSALGGEPLAPEPPDEANAPVRVTAEWLEIEVWAPDAAPEVHRRTVFDLIGAAARSGAGVPPPALAPADRLARALGLMQEVDVLVAGAAPDRGFLRHATSRDAGRLLGMTAEAVGSGATLADIAPDAIPRMPLLLHRLAALRLADDAAGGLYLARPNVLLAWSGLAGAGIEDLVPTFRFDIVANDVEPLPSADAFAARLAQGVRDTVAEHALAGPGATGNTAALYEADRAAGRAWVRLAPGDAARLGGMALPADAATAIARDLASGATVVLPEAPGPQLAWWRVDADGTTLGMTAAGGAAMTEYGFLLGQGLTFGACFYMLGATIARNLPGGGGIVGGAMICMAGNAGGITLILSGELVGGAAIGAALTFLGGAVAASQS